MKIEEPKQEVSIVDFKPVFKKPIKSSQKKT